MMRVKKFDSINIIPFIDVMLVLLTIVLMTATFVVRGEIQVNLPTSDSKSSPSDIQEKPLHLYVTKEGALYYQDELLLPEDLSSIFQSFPSASKIMLHTDKDARFENFVNVLSPLKGLGFSNIAIVTEK